MTEHDNLSVHQGPSENGAVLPSGSFPATASVAQRHPFRLSFGVFFAFVLMALVFQLFHLYYVGWDAANPKTSSFLAGGSSVELEGISVKPVDNWNPVRFDEQASQFDIATRLDEVKRGCEFGYKIETISDPGPDFGDLAAPILSLEITGQPPGTCMEWGETRSFGPVNVEVTSVGNLKGVAVWRNVGWFVQIQELLPPIALTAAGAFLGLALGFWGIKSRWLNGSEDPVS